MSQLSTGPSVKTDALNLTFSGIVSGSADVIDIISLDYSTYVNSIVLMLSKHFLK
jgi:hypothetical protein